MTETQETMTAWGDETFGPTPPAAIARRMRHEVQELLDGFEALGDLQPADIPAEARAALGEECGDIYIMLSQIAQKLGTDLPTIATAKMAVNRERRWARDPVSGTIRHVETFKEPGSGLVMDITKFYVLTDSGSYLTPKGFDTAEAAINWCHSPGGEEAGALEFGVPEFAGPQKGWPEMYATNVLFARDLYDFWIANPLEGETE
ncbi:putative pyrophosphatase [Bordetella phage FP1]|uniref:Putative pyrophosphatase n=1 Tax=Bordetella phage FP1 TaxID=1916125 RepID=A0A2D0W9K9_9CAUD|nr:putative pyrophosphatase [Bordetella phage FP1]APL99330.1 putative pyrophosphatase [Bordetella phage FP1]